MYTIFLADDDHYTRRLSAMYLQLAGYTVYELENPSSVNNAIHRRYPSLIILGIRIAGEDGFLLGYSLMKRGFPVVFLTEITTKQDQLTGLKMGAQDCILKPVDPEEFLARVANVLKGCRKSHSYYEKRGLLVDFDAREVWKNGEQVMMTTLEFNLLKALIDSDKTAMTRSELLSAVWGLQRVSATRTVDVHIQRLRGKIGAERIETIVKYGYRFQKDY